MSYFVAFANSIIVISVFQQQAGDLVIRPSLVSILHLDLQAPQCPLCTLWYCFVCFAAQFNGYILAPRIRSSSRSAGTGLNVCSGHDPGNSFWVFVLGSTFMCSEKPDTLSCWRFRMLEHFVWKWQRGMMETRALVWQRAGSFPHVVQDLEITLDLDFYLRILLRSNFTLRWL